MADRNERWVLDHLIDMCRDEELALRHAADHVKDPSVKALFVELASQRAQFAADLIPHAQRFGGTGAAGVTTRAALNRGRMALKAALRRSSDRVMIAEAGHCEDAALAAYQIALHDPLPPTARDVVERQCEEIRLAHDRVHNFLSH